MKIADRSSSDADLRAATDLEDSREPASQPETLSHDAQAEPVVDAALRQRVAELEAERAAYSEHGALLRLAAELSTSLSAVRSTQDFDSAIVEALRRLGEHLRQDRAYLFQFSDDLERMSNTHEWCASGVAPQMHRIQDMPTDSVPWWKARMLAYRLVHLPDIEALPDEAQVEKLEFRAQGICSLLCLPTISTQGALTGFLGFDAVAAPYQWSENEMVTLRLVSDAIGATLARRKAEEDFAQAQRALRESEQRFQSIFDNAAHGMVVVEVGEDAELRVVDFYRTQESSIDMLREELQAKPLDASARAMCLRCLETGRPIAYESELLLPEQGRRHFHTTVAPIREPGGRLSRIISSAIDVTERKRAEQALAHERNLYKDLVSSQPAGVYRLRILAQRPWSHAEWVSKVESNYQLEMVSDRFCEMMGASREDFEANTALVVERIHPEDRDDFVARNVVSLETFEPFHWEGRLLTPMGVLWVYFASVARRIGNGDVIWTGMLLDVTARRKAEQDYQKLFESMHAAFALHEVVFDASGAPVDYRFLAVNPAFEQQTGLKSSDVVGRTALELLPATEKEWIDRYCRVALGAAPITFQDYHAQLGRHFEVTAYSPAPGQFAATFIDITERKRAEDEKAKLLEQLHHAQKMEAIGTLAGGIAHDFNNILAGLMGGLSLLEAEASERGRDDVEELRELEAMVQRGADLAKQLLGFSRRGKYDVRPLDLAMVVEKTSRMFGRTRRDLSIRHDFSPELRRVLMDHTQLEQVLLNLFINAGQAMPEGGQLLLRAENVDLTEALAQAHGIASGPFVRLVVADTGRGMDAATKARIFEPFFTTRPQGQGTGLGLASVYGIVSNHGGMISVESEPGEGSAFTISLPSTEASHEASLEAVFTPTPGLGTILVVDDEELILRTCARMLRNMGYEALTASSGAAAVELLRENVDKVRLVILDLTMPVMSGAQTFEKLREVSPQLEVLLSSGFSEDAQAQALMQRGCRGFLPKPYSLAKLVDALGRVKFL